MGMVFGFKLHALTSVEGLFERWAFAAANHADVTLAKELMEGLEEEVIVGDKAYIGIGVLTPARSNMTGDRVWTQQLSRARKRIESSFSSLVRSLTLHAAQVKTFLSLTRIRVQRTRPWVRLWTRVNRKIAAFNLLGRNMRLSLPPSSPILQNEVIPVWKVISRLLFLLLIWAQLGEICSRTAPSLLMITPLPAPIPIPRALLTSGTHLQGRIRWIW